MIVIEVREVSETDQVQYTHLYTVKSTYDSDFQVVCRLMELIRSFKAENEE